MTARRQQSLLLADLSRLLYNTLRDEIRQGVNEINSVYSDRYSSPEKHLGLNEAYTSHIEVRMGTNFEVLNVRLMESGQVFEVRHQLPGMPRSVVTNYRSRLDHEDRLYLETNGQPVPTEELPQRILGFLTD